MRVLVVDDERPLARELALGLSANDMSVDHAYDGDEGLFKALEGSFDAIILDLELPGKSGLDVCRALRAAQNWTPILILTACCGDVHEARSLNLGADDFLAKPFSFPVLVAHLRALARRGNTPRSPVIQVGSLTLDPLRHSCTRAGSSIELSPREFEVLELFMRHPNEVLSKQRILDHVWGLDFEGDYNLVEVYVSYLRRKIDEPFGCHSIRTVRGVGYRLHERS